MARVTDAMEALAAHLRARVSRPVTTDPRAVVNTPCVLVEPPLIQPGTLCDEWINTYQVMVIGLPGARAELNPLAALLEQVLEALPAWTQAEPVGYVPLTQAGTADVCQAYRVTYEEVS